MSLNKLEYLGNIDTVLIDREIALKFRNVDAEILSEFFQYSDVELRIFFTLAHRITQKDRFTYKLNGDKQDRSIVRLRLILLKPLEETYGEIKCACTVLFDR